jgi:hypothetical protein
MLISYIWARKIFIRNKDYKMSFINSIMNWFTASSKPAQEGGSDYYASFYAKTAVGGPGEITRQTLAVIDRTPMFNPFNPNAVIPGPSTGIVPSAYFYRHQ